LHLHKQQRGTSKSNEPNPSIWMKA
jgi:hypothetical protein